MVYTSRNASHFGIMWLPVTSHVHTVSLFVTYIEMNQIAPVRNASIVQPYTKTMQARMYAVLVVYVPFS